MGLVLSASAITQAKKVEYMGNVKNLIVASQKTRGGTYNFLNGSEFAQFGVFEQRSKIKKAFKAINHDYYVVGRELDGEFDKLRKQMKSLNKMAFQLEPLTSFKAYSVLINKMIVTGGKVQIKLFGKGSELDKRASDLMMNKIMPLTEGLGKLRGLGSGIAARNECEDDEIDYMEEYVEEVHVNMNKVITAMVNINKKYGKKYPEGLNEQLTKYRKDVNKYVALAKTKLIGKDGIKVDPNQYFDQGTKLIGGAIKFYTMNEKALKK